MPEQSAAGRVVARLPAFSIAPAPTRSPRAAPAARTCTRACASAPPPAPARALVKTVLPADSDYSGALWHGAYVRWLEEARVRALAAAGLEYGALVAGGVELVVSRLEVRYRAAARLGDEVAVRGRADAALSTRVRIVTVSEFVRVRADGAEEVLATAEVAVTPVAVESGRAMRKWPPELTEAVRRLFKGDDGEDGEVPAWLER